MIIVFDLILIFVVGIRGILINVFKSNKNINIKFNCLYVYFLLEGNRKKNYVILKKKFYMYINI